MLNKKKLSSYLNYDYNIEYFDVIDSTSMYLLRNNNQFKKDTIVIANEQTAGKGQYGRKFYSPKNTGLYFSLLIKNMDINSPSFKQLMMNTAVSLVDTIKDIYDIDLKIKWVNDLIYQNKKFAGILIQNTHTKNGIDVIIGIGMNLFKPKDGFNELEDIAVHLLNNKEINKEYLIANIINNIYANMNSSSVYLSYLKHSIVLNETVIYKNNEVFVENINEDCSLSVRDGYESFNIYSGSISLKDNS